MSLPELHKALDRAEKANDVESQIHVLYILGLRAKDGTKEGTKEALALYKKAFGLATTINLVELQGPIEVDLALLHYTLGAHNKATRRLEHGLQMYLVGPEDRAKKLNTDILWQFFRVLNDCYDNLKAYQRGVDYLVDYSERWKAAGGSEALLPSLTMSTAEFCFVLEDFEGCSRHLEGAAELVAKLPQEKTWDYYYYLGWSYVKQRKFKEALPVLSTLVSVGKAVQAPESYILDSMEQIAAIHDMLGEKDEAIVAFDEVVNELRKVNLQTNPRLGVKHYYFLGILAGYRLGNPKQAIDLLYTAYSLAKALPEIPWHRIAVDLADVQFILKDRAKSCAQLNIVLDAPDVEDEVAQKVLFKLARIYSELGEKEKAVTAYEKLLERLHVSQDKDKESSEVIVNHRLGKLYVLMGYPSKGLHFLETARAKMGENHELKNHILAGVTNAKAVLGERQEALRGVDELVEASAGLKDSAYAETTTDIGEILFLLGDYEKATETFQKALGNYGESLYDSTLCRLRLSWLLAYFGDTAKAWEQMTLVKKVADEDQARSWLGAAEIGYANYYLLAGEVSKALASVKECAGFLDPACIANAVLSLISYHMALAEAYLWTGNKGDALASMVLVLSHLSSASTSPVKENIVLCIDTSIKLAWFYLLLGDSETAAELLQSIISLKEKGSTRNTIEAQVLLASIGEGKDEPLQEGLALAAQLGDKRLEGHLQARAGVFYFENDKVKAHDHFEKALQLSRDAKDKLTEAFSLTHLCLLTGSEETRAAALKLADELGAGFLNSFLSGEGQKNDSS